jgi:hypothetical protein
MDKSGDNKREMKEQEEGARNWQKIGRAQCSGGNQMI